MWRWVADKVLGVFSGNLLEFGKEWLNSRNQSNRVKREIMGDLITADVEAKKLAVQVMLAEQDWWVTRWIRPLFAYPLIVYTICIVADSVYFHSGQIQALPTFLEEWYGWIVAAYFVMRPVEKAVRGFHYKIR